MSKYRPLGDHLAAIPAEQAEVELSFVAIARLVGGLPPTAGTSRQWWANNSQVQALEWRRVGWHVERPYFDRGVVRFGRGSRGGSYAAAGRAPTAREERTRAPVVRSGITGSAPAGAELMDVKAEWHWEGNVQTAVIRALVADGWSIVRAANTATREQGVDIIAVRDRGTLLVEVKGFPSTVYARGERAGQAKRTPPTVQAKHWFAEAMLKAVRLRHSDLSATVFIAYPAHPRYSSLLSETKWALDALAIGVLAVHEDGRVEGLPQVLAAT